MISYKLYQKPCHSGLLVDYCSAVPQQQKFAVATSQILRAERLSSNTECYERSEEKIIQQLRFNNYPEAVIEAAKTECR